MTKPRILIATGVFPPDLGGPAKYALNFSRTFEGRGYEVEVVAYGRRERVLPPFIRHLFFFFRLCTKLRGTDYIFALDTWSVGVPAFCASVVGNKPFIVRVGGDFLWESFVERTRSKVLLSEFYTADRPFSFKERIIFSLSAFVFRKADAVVFTTSWLREIFKRAYFLPDNILHVVENFISPASVSPLDESAGKVFLSSSRTLFLKNQEVLRKAFLEAKKKDDTLSLISHPLPPQEFARALRQAYAIIVPSLSEVSPNLVLEALSLGKPVIVTKDCGIEGQIRDGALFVDPLSVSDIAEKILLLSDGVFYQKQKEAIKHSAYTHSWDEIGDEFLQIFLGLSSKAPSVNQKNV
jgi:glycosyltransferase involved in cell wall biosynthesis